MTVDTYTLPTTEAPTRKMPDWYDSKTERPDMTASKSKRRNGRDRKRQQPDDHD